MMNVMVRELHLYKAVSKNKKQMVVREWTTWNWDRGGFAHW